MSKFYILFEPTGVNNLNNDKHFSTLTGVMGNVNQAQALHTHSILKKRFNVKICE